MNNFMEIALKEAQKAYKKDEVPVGAVIVQNNKIIAKAHNLRQTKKCSTKHAEIIAIEKACKKIKNWHLDACEMYVTLEPCPMCAGAIINSRIRKVTILAVDEKSGCFGGKVNFNEIKFNHNPTIEFLENGSESVNLLQNFFKEKRKLKKGGR